VFDTSLYIYVLNTSGWQIFKKKLKVILYTLLLLLLLLLYVSVYVEYPAWRHLHLNQF